MAQPMPMEAAILLVWVEQLQTRITLMERQQQERLEEMEAQQQLRLNEIENQRCGMCLHHVERLGRRITELGQRLAARIEELEYRLDALVLRLN